MKKRNTVKKVSVKSCLTVSDWVTFLSNERQGMTSNVVNVSVFLVAAIALILVASAHIALAVISTIIVFGSAGWVYFQVLEPLNRRGYLADHVLKGIISGELRDAEAIRGEWTLGLAIIKRRRLLRQIRARLAVLKRAWRHEWKPALVAFAAEWRRRSEAAVTVVKDRWSQEKARMVALARAWECRWEEALTALRQTWDQEKARLATLAQTWRLW